MAKVKMKVSTIVNLGLWSQVAEHKGWNPYALNEGLIDYDEEVEFDDEFKKETVFNYFSYILRCGSKESSIISPKLIYPEDIIQLEGKFYCIEDIFAGVLRATEIHALKVERND